MESLTAMAQSHDRGCDSQSDERDTIEVARPTSRSPNSALMSKLSTFDDGFRLCRRLSGAKAAQLPTSALIGAPHARGMTPFEFAMEEVGTALSRLGDAFATDDPITRERAC